MNNPIRWVLEQIAERLVPLVGDALAGTLVTMLSLGRAEQQSELEEAARRYEAEGNPHIAQALRQQSARLTVCDPAADAKRICAHLSGNLNDSVSAAEAPSLETSGQLPDFSTPPTRSRKKKPRKGDANSGDACNSDC